MRLQLFGESHLITNIILLLFFLLFPIDVNTYSLGEVRDKMTMKQIDKLLEKEGIQRDGNLDYTCAIFDDDYNVIGTGSLFGNTIRCMAVSSDHQGEGLTNQILSHLMQIQFERGNYHLFFYTKISSAKFFEDLGFYEITRVQDMLVFMENKRDGFKSYLKKLRENTINSEIYKKTSGKNNLKVAAVVMNANPFTLGHQYLIEKCSNENDIVHLFVISEDASLIPFKIRKKLIQKGTEHLKNIILHESGPYIISNATFPSYFLKDEIKVMTGHAKLDVNVFIKIAKELGINNRYVGDEPFSEVTRIYNDIMKNELPKYGIECVIVPRKTNNDNIISASIVRTAIQNGDIESLKNMVPKTTYDFFISDEAKNIIEKIKKTKDVIHH